MRCGHLANLSKHDLNVLEDIGVTQNHDFRRKEDQTRSPSCAARESFFIIIRYILVMFHGFGVFLRMNSH